MERIPNQSQVFGRNVWAVAIVFVLSCSASNGGKHAKLKTPAKLPEPEPVCLVEENFIREGSTYNDPSELRTSTPEECCAICAADDRCVSWTRNKETEACALKDTLVELRRNTSFDSGVIGGSPAPQDVQIDDQCIVEGRVDFVGEDFREEESEDPQECCRMCEDDLDCFSWTRDRSTGRCFLKTGVPERVENDGTDGGTIF